MSCGNPTGGVNNVKNGDIIDNPTSDRTFGAVILYQCDPGYIASASPNRICEITGSWSTRPICIAADCGRIVPPSNGIISSVDANGEVTFSCNTGYTLHGSEVVTCGSDNNWDNEFPFCDIVNCEDPGIPPNSIRIGNSFSYTSGLIFSCDSGYALLGSSMIVCLSDGVWSDDNPWCINTEIQTTSVGSQSNVTSTSNALAQSSTTPISNRPNSFMYPQLPISSMKIITTISSYETLSSSNDRFSTGLTSQLVQESMPSVGNSNSLVPTIGAELTERTGILAAALVIAVTFIVIGLAVVVTLVLIRKRMGFPFKFIFLQKKNHGDTVLSNHNSGSFQDPPITETSSDTIRKDMASLTDVEHNYFKVLPMEDIQVDRLDSIIITLSYYN